MTEDGNDRANYGRPRTEDTPQPIKQGDAPGSPTHLSDLQGMCEKAEPGPWDCEDEVNPHMVTRGRDADGAFLYVADVGYVKYASATARFIARARTAIPELLSTLAGKEAEIATVEADRDALLELFQFDEDEVAQLRPNDPRTAAAIVLKREAYEEWQKKYAAMKSRLATAVEECAKATCSGCREGVATAGVYHVESHPLGMVSQKCSALDIRALKTPATEGREDMGSYDARQQSASNTKSGKDD